MLFDNSQSVTLRVHGTESLPRNGLIYEWKCRKCECTTGTSICSFKTFTKPNFFFPAQVETVNAETAQIMKPMSL